MVAKGLLIVTLLFLAGATFAGDQNFPVGLWFSDAPIISNDWAEGGFPPSVLAQLRWRDIDLGHAGGYAITRQKADWLNRRVSRNIQKKLVRYDSLGYRIWLDPIRFNFSYPDSPSTGQDKFTPTHDGMDVNGHHPTNPATQAYFISRGRGPYPGGGGWRQYQDPDPTQYRTKEAFNAYLDSVVNDMVDSVKNYHALWRYFWWDEFNSHHSYRTSVRRGTGGMRAAPIQPSDTKAPVGIPHPTTPKASPSMSGPISTARIQSATLLL